MPTSLYVHETTCSSQSPGRKQMAYSSGVIDFESLGQQGCEAITSPKPEGARQESDF